MSRRLGWATPALLALVFVACRPGTSLDPSQSDSVPLPPRTLPVDAAPVPSPTSPRVTPPPPKDAVSFPNFDINHVLVAGQGNAIGVGTVEALSTTQPYENWMFDVGVITSRTCDAQGCVDHARATALVPLAEGTSPFTFGPAETVGSGFANTTTLLLRNGPEAKKHPLLVTAHGRSEDTYHCIRRGGCDYRADYLGAFAEGAAQIEEAKAIAAAKGRSYAVRAVALVHGESDHYAAAFGAPDFPLESTRGGPVVMNYADGLLELQRDYDETARTVTGQEAPVYLLVSQTSGWTGARASEIPLRQLEAHDRSSGNVVVVGPTYALPWSDDCQHLSARGERQLGEYFAKAYTSVLLRSPTPDAARFQPLRPQRVTLDGAVITASFQVPKPPLVLDVTRVVDPGNLGFEYADDDEDPPTIAAVTVAGPTVVQITLSRAPTAGNRRLRYALNAPADACPGPTAGARGNLRDSDDTRSLFGDELFNWSVHFDVPIGGGGN